MVLGQRAYPVLLERNLAGSSFTGESMLGLEFGVWGFEVWGRDLGFEV